MQSAFGVEHGEVSKGVKLMAPAKKVLRPIQRKAKAEKLGAKKFPSTGVLKTRRDRI